MHKKMIAYSVLVVTLSVVAITGMTNKVANAGIIDSIMNSDLPTKEVTANYEISVYGYDARVYEWTPEGNENVTCVFVSSNKSSGVACYDDVKDSKNR